MSFAETTEIYYIPVQIFSSTLDTVKEELPIFHRLPFSSDYIIFVHHFIFGLLWGIVGQFGTGQFSTGQFGTGQFGTGQFGTGQFGTKIIKRTIWHQDNKSGQFGTKIIKVDNLAPGQFGTRTIWHRTIWHQDNLAPNI